MNAYGGSYYPDDGLGGLGDDGLGGLGQPYQAPPPMPMYGDDGLGGLFMPAEEEPEPQGLTQPEQDDEQQEQADQEQEQSQQQQQQQGGEPMDDELGDALDEAFGLEPTQTASQHDSQAPSRSQAAASFDDEATEDEPDGEEQTGGRAEAAEEPQQPEDPAAAEAQRQNAWYKECFDAMTEPQRNRLEAYIRSNLQKKTMKKVLQELTGATLNDRIVIAISSITKLFVGELVETARQIAARQGHTGALLPSHIRAAYNALSADGRVPHRNSSKPVRLL